MCACVYTCLCYVSEYEMYNENIKIFVSGEFLAVNRTQNANMKAISTALYLMMTMILLISS